MKVKRYSVRAWLSFSVYEGENVDDKLHAIERAYDDDHIPPGDVYVGFDPNDKPILEDERTEPT